jgi:hypothetical protein
MSTAARIFVGQLFNSLFVYVLVFARDDTVRAALAANKVSNLLPILAGRYDDTTAGWYGVVGSSIVRPPPLALRHPPSSS